MAAVATNGVIGRDGDLPWRLPADLRRFRSLTTGHHLLVGRRTWESIGRPLRGRRILVLSRRPDLDLPEGVEQAPSFESALTRARGRGEEELFVAGGAEVYRVALPVADRLYLTRVDHAVDGDTKFPEWRPDDWSLAGAEALPTSKEGEPGLRFEVWDRIRR